MRRRVSRHDLFTRELFCNPRYTIHFYRNRKQQKHTRPRSETISGIWIARETFGACAYEEYQLWPEVTPSQTEIPSDTVTPVCVLRFRQQFRFAAGRRTLAVLWRSLVASGCWRHRGPVATTTLRRRWLRRGWHLDYQLVATAVIVPLVARGAAAQYVDDKYGESEQYACAGDGHAHVQRVDRPPLSPALVRFMTVVFWRTKKHRFRNYSRNYFDIIS